MARKNIKTPAAPIYTHGGGRAVRAPNKLEQLRRSVLSCMLFEGEFYEDGESIANRIAKLALEVAPEDLAALAIEARTSYNLRHAPLLLTRALVRTGAGRSDGLVSKTLAQVIQRADEMGEFLAIYHAGGRQPLAGQVKKGLALALDKFDEHQLAKYNRDVSWKIRDVMFMTHANPGQKEDLYKRLADDELETPDTWEVNLSGGANKRETFERLLTDGKLGYMALLKNLRGMSEAGVNTQLIRQAILDRQNGAHRVFPFRFVSAAKAAPQFEPELDQAMIASLANSPKLPGKTLALLDVSGSMYGRAVSAKSDIDRAYAACALGAILREVCETPYVYATAGSDSTRIHQTKMVPARRGMALIDAIHGMCRPLGGGGIFMNQALRYCQEQLVGEEIDRVVIFTDEQDCGVGADSAAKAPLLGSTANYVINVSSYEKGIAYPSTGWVHLNGFSESVIRYMIAMEHGVTG